MILTHHGMNSLSRSGTDKVKIGGRVYPVVRIGDQIWMAENLDYKFSYNGSTLPIGVSGSPPTPAAWYHDNDEATYGIDGTRKCGLLYNWYAIELLNDNRSTLCPGWHVPTDSEWNDLVTAVGGTSTAGTKLKASGISWVSPSWYGTDDYGFSAIPAGNRYSGRFDALGVDAAFWTATQSSIYAEIRYFNARASINSGGYSKANAYSVRLVKD